MVLLPLKNSTLTCGCPGRPPRCPWSCSSHFLLAHNKWSAVQAADRHKTVRFIWTNFIPNKTFYKIRAFCITSKLTRSSQSKFDICHHVTHFLSLTVDLKKRMTWAISKFWSAHSMSPAICLHKPSFPLQHGCNSFDQRVETIRRATGHWDSRTTMMSSCSLRLRMASCRSATAPSWSSSVVLPSFITFSTGKSFAVAQRS